MVGVFGGGRGVALNGGGEGEVEQSVGLDLTEEWVEARRLNDPERLNVVHLLHISL